LRDNLKRVRLPLGLRTRWNSLSRINAFHDKSQDVSSAFARIGEAQIGINADGELSSVEFLVVSRLASSPRRFSLSV
jgi:hypothetical protein